MYRSGARLPTNCDIIIHGAHLATLKYFLVKDKFPTASSKRFNYVIYNYGHNVSGSKYYMAAERENSLRKPRLMPALSIADWTWIERARIICFKEVVNIGITIWSLLGSLMIRVLRTERRFISEEYFYYPLSIAILLVVSLVTDIREVHGNQLQLAKSAGPKERVFVAVKRQKDSGVFLDKVPSEELVPGEVIIIPRHESQMVADAVIIEGSCVVNEAGLTGESVPVVKTSIKACIGRNILYNSERHSRCTLLSGTDIMQTRSSRNVEAMVIRTGFSTEKGKLLGAMIYPKPVDFQLARDVDNLLKCLLPIAAVAFLGLMTYKRVFQNNYFALDFKTSFDIISLAMPPGLPAAMSIAGRVPAQQRLSEAQIFCTSPKHITIGGCITCFCFDKTGTLTETDLNLWGVFAFDRPEPIKDPSTLPFDHAMRVAMASCHALTRSYDKLLGDPMDVKIFEATRYVFDDCNLYSPYGYYANERIIVRPMFQEASNQHGATDDTKKGPPFIQRSRPFEIGILYVYPFSSALQRMSVLTIVDNSTNLTVFAKGAPETLANLCVKESIPKDFKKKLTIFAKEGYRVIAVATKELPSNINNQNLKNLSRQEIESQLTMLGFIIMENRLRRQTKPVLKKLKEANIRPIMVTGDNLLTALTVARECGMIESTEPIIRIELDDSGTDIYWAYYDIQDHVEAVAFTGNVPKDQEYQQASSAKSEYWKGVEKHPQRIFKILPNEDKEIRISYTGNFQIVTTGNALAIIRRRYPKILHKVIVRGIVFARMTPDSKTHFVEDLQAVGHCVGFCGDGLNDCGALKGANIGIALLGSEASIYSPFTSTSSDISCIIKLISECRAALVTSCATLRFMACYAFLQGTAIVIVEIVGVQFTDLEFVFIDICLSMGTMTFFGLTHPSATLAKTPPAKSAIGLVSVISIVVHTVISVSTQVIFVFFLWDDDGNWYVSQPKPTHEHTDGTGNLVNGSVMQTSHQLEPTERPQALKHYIVFVVNVFQYIALAVGFSVGAPHRRALITNYYLVAYLIGISLVCTYLALQTAGYLLDLGYLPMQPTERLLLVILGYGQITVSYIVENLIMTYLSPLISERDDRLHPPEFTRLYRELQGQDPSSWLPKQQRRSEDDDSSPPRSNSSKQDQCPPVRPSIINTIDPCLSR
ncbi:probable cation-transporting ATPase 13A3 isoform X2 [Varroa destructor]|uniref:P-type ATPase A domain-containing protein n=1 Tax=Varroa destructor TaxID=109461 RepID=A0A7M7KNG7_VARDE|nr:probable cation-transporting ATPase 13A3 isoform X2 [Varroa destructor]